MKLRVALVLIVTAMLASCGPAAMQRNFGDPLPSWNDGPAKNAIIGYVMSATDPRSDGFIPIEDRIATFDNDGTLMAERPIVQVEFAIFCARKAITDNPRIALEQPFKAVAENDMDHLAELPMRESFAFSCWPMEGRTTEEFRALVEEFLDYGVYPGLSCPISATRYQPQLELIDYLHANDFKVYICSGSTTDFLAALSQRLFGIGPERIIGSVNHNRYRDSLGVAEVVLSADMAILNNKGLKPVNILQATGRRPVLACGNEGGAGDVQMLRYSQGGPYPTLQLIINHDDGRREFEYSETPDVSLSMARQYGWQIVSIKEDWKTVFAE